MKYAGLLQAIIFSSTFTSNPYTHERQSPRNHSLHMMLTDWIRNAYSFSWFRFSCKTQIISAIW